jgi:hypothetical protein
MGLSGPKRTVRPTMNSIASQHPIARLLNVGVRVVQILAWVFLVFGAVMLGLGIIAEMSGGSLHLPFGQALVEGVSLANFIVAFAAMVVMLPGLIFICDQLKRILTTLSDGEPFVAENAPRLKRIAIAVALMEFARMAIAATAMALLESGSHRLGINLAAWIGVAVLFVLSSVFAEGTRLREEEKMTI